MQYTLITGASSGLGADFARQCAAKGQNLILTARSTGKLEALAGELHAQFGIKAEVVPADLSKLDGPETLHRETERRGLIVHTLVNNAGLGHSGPFPGSDWQRQEEMIQVNARALTRLCHLYLPAMLARKSGAILNVASTASFQPGPLMSVYFASKAFVLSFSEALAFELRHSGVVVSCLCPGPTETNFQEVALGKPVTKKNNTLLFRLRAPASSPDVVRVGLAGLERGQSVVIEGFMNWLLARLVPFTPRPIVLWGAEQLQKAKP